MDVPLCLLHRARVRLGAIGQHVPCCCELGVGVFALSETPSSGFLV